MRGKLWQWEPWRTWRKSRPFWGGLLTMLAGFEIIALPWAPMDLIIRVGIGALSGFIIGGVLILAGLLLWFQPAQRTFLSIVAILLGLASFPFTNLGGFVIGMLMALIGGSLAFAWEPVNPDAQAAKGKKKTSDDADDDTATPAEAKDETATAELPGLPLQPHTPASETTEHSGRHSARPGAGNPESASTETANTEVSGGTTSPRKIVAGAILPLSLLAAGLMAPGLDMPAFAAPGDGAIPCPPGVQAPAQPGAQPAPAPAPNPNPAPAPVPAPSQGVPTVPAPTAPATTRPATAQPPASPTPSPSPDKPWWWPFSHSAPEGTGNTAGHPAVKAAPNAAPAKPSATTSPLCHRKVAAAAAQPPVSWYPSRIKASVQEMTGMKYVGVVELPRLNQAPIRTLYFQMSSSTSTPFEMNSPDEATGKTLNQKSSRLRVSGDVHFYASKFHAKLLGIPVTFTPDSPPPLVLPWMIFTDAEIDLVFLDTNKLEAPNLIVKYV